jgi:hypothetical protein
MANFTPFNLQSYIAMVTDTLHNAAGEKRVLGPNTVNILG